MAMINAPPLPRLGRILRSSASSSPTDRSESNCTQNDTHPTSIGTYESVTDLSPNSADNNPDLESVCVPTSRTIHLASSVASPVVQEIALEGSSTSDPSVHVGSTTPSEPSLKAPSPVPLILINDEKPLRYKVAIMSENYYYAPSEQEEPVEEDFPLEYIPAYTTYPTTSPPAAFGPFTVPSSVLQFPHQRQPVIPQQIVQPQSGYVQAPSIGPTTWQAPAPGMQQLPTGPIYGYQGYDVAGTSLVAGHDDNTGFSFDRLPTVGPSTNYLRPPAGPSQTRLQRTPSVNSQTSSVGYSTDNSRSISPNAAEMSRWGTRNEDGTWNCSHPGCRSTKTFSRGCDLRKHYKRHTKTLFCRYPGCPQATRGGFSDKKDLHRHEQKHNPQVDCEWPGCERRGARGFSRHDNMKDHVQRVHLKDARRGR